MLLEDCFKDIPSISLFSANFKEDDIVWVSLFVDEQTTYSSLKVAKIVSFISPNQISENGVEVDCLLVDEGNARTEAVIVFPYRRGGALTKDGIKYPVTTLIDKKICTRFFSPSEIGSKYTLVGIMNVPGSRLNLHIMLSGTCLFSSVDEIKNYVQKETFRNPVLSSQGIELTIGNERFLFENYRVFDLDRPIKLSHSYVFNYMLNNCEPTPDTSGSFSFSKKFPLNFEQIKPIDYIESARLLSIDAITR